MKIVFKERTNQRIDKFLSSLQIEELYSRSKIDKLILENHIKVNQASVKKSYILQPEDVIEIFIPSAKDLSLKPEDISLEIVYEDNDLVIINKPAGLTVHPAPGNTHGTLVNALLYHFRGKLSAGNDPCRPGIVHRLDKDTSGLILVAKNDRVHSLLSAMFQQRKIDKFYKAITVGIPKEPEGTIETFIERSKTNRKKMMVSNSGKNAITHYKIEKYFDFFSIVEVKLETGRTHQIRVQFSHINCPILGDNTYSSMKRTLNFIPSNFHKKLKDLLRNHLQRQALHAFKLEFIHPISEKKICIEIPLPDDILYVTNWLNRNFG